MSRTACRPCRRRRRRCGRIIARSLRATPSHPWIECHTCSHCSTWLSTCGKRRSQAEWTRNLAARPAHEQSTGVVHCRARMPGRSVPGLVRGAAGGTGPGGGVDGAYGRRRSTLARGRRASAAAAQPRGRGFGARRDAAVERGRRRRRRDPRPDDFYRSAHGRIYTTLRALFARGSRSTSSRQPSRSSATARSTTSAGASTSPTSPTRCPPRRPRPTTPRSCRRRRSAGAYLGCRRHHGPRLRVDRRRGSRRRRRQQRIYEVARREDRDEMAVLRDLVDQAMLDLESIQTRESAYTGLPTGFIDIDNLTSGLQPGNLIVVAARPGIGKSSLGVNMARNIAVSGEPVCIFSLEMSRWEIGMRLLCAEARVPGSHPQQARRAQRLAGRGAGRRDPARRAAVDRRLGQHQHRRHPGQGKAMPRGSAASRSSSSTTSSSRGTPAWAGASPTPASRRSPRSAGR